MNSLVAFWYAFVAFVASFFRRSSAPSLPTPATSAATTPRRFHGLSGLFATPPSLPSGPSLPESIHTTSDGSLEVVSLGDRRGFPSSPGMSSDITPLPSPWSPLGKTAPQDVWMSVDGTLVNATGPVNHSPVSPTGFRMSTPSLYSSSSALDAFGISVFVHLGDTLNTPDAKQVESNDKTLSTPATQGPRTPRRRRETIPSAKKSGASSNTARATKCLSTPLTRIENVDVSHLRSTNSFSSMAYEFRMGLIADGRSMTAIEHILSFLDQDSPEHTQPLNTFTQPVEVV